MSGRIILHQVGYDPYYKTWHTTGHNMLIYMHSDGGCIVCSENIYPIEEGALCFIGAKKHHYTMPEDPSKYDRSKVFMEPLDFEKLLSLLKAGSPLPQTLSDEAFVYARIASADRPQVEALFDEINRFNSDPRHADAVFFSCYLKLLTFLDRYAVDSISPPPNRMSEAIAFINNNIQSELCIDDICSTIPMSKFHFCRQFKKTTGMTIMEYILKTRLTLAKSLLSKEGLTISQISEECGFSSSSYFCRVFKSCTGLTPLQYRKNSNI